MIESLKTDVGEQTFESGIRPIRLVAEWFLSQHFGERCEDMHADCEICRRYAALDVFTENPFSE